MLANLMWASITMFNITVRYLLLLLEIIIIQDFKTQA